MTIRVMLLLKGWNSHRLRLSFLFFQLFGRSPNANYISVGCYVVVDMTTLIRMRAMYCCRGDILQDELWVERLPYGVIHKQGDVVAGKYTITGVFGQGAMGVTYEAERDDGEVVALKAMSLRNMKGWKVCFFLCCCCGLVTWSLESSTFKQ